MGFWANLQLAMQQRAVARAVARAHRRHPKIGGESAHHKKKRRRALFHGEPELFDAGDMGDGTAYEPNYGAADMASMTGTLDPSFINSYGAGDTGQEFEPTLEDGGIDPFANAVFDEPGLEPRDQRNARSQLERADLAPGGFDIFDPPERIPTLRNAVVDFGLDDSFYSGVGPAAIIGCDSCGGLKK